MISGSIVAVVTPMLENGDIDWKAIDGLVSFHIEAGTDAIVAVGTTGESATLSVEEHTKVIESMVIASNGKIPIIAGTGANSTTEAVELTENAKKVGVDACLLVTPYYNKPTQEGLYRHFAYIADAVDVPQILYNVPGRTACDMQTETVLRLTEVAPIVGIKEATGDLTRAKDLIAACPDDFAVYSGDDPTALELILLGGKGNISVTANVAPKMMADLCKAALQGNGELAKQIDDQLQPLNEKLFLESNPIPVKWALEEMGLIGPGIRLPLTRFSEQYQSELRAAMSGAGVL